MKKFKFLIPLLALTPLNLSTLVFTSCNPKKVNFSWDAFLDRNGDGKWEQKEESRWEYLIDCIESGLDSQGIMDAISKSELDGVSGEFSWDKEYIGIVKITGKLYKVRLIGLDFDKLTNGNNATMTWEFLNVICGADGKEIEINWSTDESKGSRNYFESLINDNLNSDDDVTWHRYNQPFFNEKRSVYNMMISGNQAFEKGIKEVQRNVNVYIGDNEWSHENYGTVKLFLPTMNNYYTDDEVADLNLMYLGECGSQYPYYKRHIDTPCMSEETECLEKQTVDRSYIGYWLSSPQVTNVYYAEIISSVGRKGSLEATNFAPVAPCFCI